MDSEVPGGINEASVLGLQMVNVRQAFAVSYKFVTGKADTLWTGGGAQTTPFIALLVATLRIYTFLNLVPYEYRRFGQ